MVAAIRKILTVSPQGTLEIRSPELSPGTQAEVIVLLGISPALQTAQPHATLQALDALQQSLALKASTAQKWIALARAERQAFGRGQ